MNGSSADPSSAASSTNTSEPPKSPGHGHRHSSGTPQYCTTFIDYLDAARVVRNRVMHFDEDLKPAEKLKLGQCLNFIRALDPFP